MRELDAADAGELLDVLPYIDPSLWDDYYTAFDTLVEYGRREPRRKR